jgi:subtilisin-like proprotein convertase family protein
MKSRLFALVACCPLFLAGPLHAATVVLGQSVETAIPDNNDTGLVSVIPFVGADFSVTAVEVLLETTGGWNGDLYAYLEHNGIISVLINRPGKTAGNPAGAASSGMTISFNDTALADIHTAISDTAGLPAVGTYQPDARIADPLVVTDLSPRSKFLAGFNGTNPNGAWTLFIADQSGGDVAVLKSWSLVVTAVPEPSSALLAMTGAAALLFVRRRNRR